MPIGGVQGSTLTVSLMRQAYRTYQPHECRQQPGIHALNNGGQTKEDKQYAPHKPGVFDRRQNMGKRQVPVACKEGKPAAKGEKRSKYIESDEVVTFGSFLSLPTFALQSVCDLLFTWLRRGAGKL